MMTCSSEIITSGVKSREMKKSATMLFFTAMLLSFLAYGCSDRNEGGDSSPALEETPSSSEPSADKEPSDTDQPSATEETSDTEEEQEKSSLAANPPIDDEENDENQSARFHDIFYGKLSPWVSAEYCETTQFPELCARAPLSIHRPVTRAELMVDPAPVSEPLATALALDFSLKRKIRQQKKKGSGGLHYSCHHVKDLIGTTYLWDLHHAGITQPLKKDFLRKVLLNYLAELDYLQIYLSQEEVTSLAEEHLDLLWQDISAGTCRSLHQIHQAFSQRYKERNAALRSFLSELDPQSILPISMQPSLLLDMAQARPQEDYVGLTYFSEADQLNEGMQQRIILLTQTLADKSCNLGNSTAAFLARSGQRERDFCLLTRGRLQHLIHALNQHSYDAEEDINDPSAIVEALQEVLPTFDEQVVELTDGLSPYSSFTKAFFWAFEENNLLCQDVKVVFEEVLNHHYTIASYADTAEPIGPIISPKAIESFISSLDPHGIYFLKEDIHLFRSQYTPHLMEKIVNRQCQDILEIARIHSKRVRDHYPLIKANIFKNHDFSVDEQVLKDISLEDYPTQETLPEAIRKYAKFQIIQGQKKYNLARSGDKIHSIRAQNLKDLQKELSAVENLSVSGVYQKFIQAFLSSLDRNSRFVFGAREAAGEVFGIGVQFASRQGYVLITQIIPGGSAHGSGVLSAGDRIIAARQDVEGSQWVSFSQLSEKGISDLITGAQGSAVHLRIRSPRGKAEGFSFAEFDVKLMRKKLTPYTDTTPYHLFSVQSTLSHREVKVGWVKFTAFKSAQRWLKDYGSSHLVGSAVAQLKEQEADVIVMDLRRNPGGAMDQSLNIAGLFIDSDVLAMSRWHSEKAGTKQTDDQEYQELRRWSPLDPRIEYYESRHASHRHHAIPLVVLVNSFSASASELVSRAVMVHGRGIVVGGLTFGKGTMQRYSHGDLLGTPAVGDPNLFRLIHTDKETQSYYDFMPILKANHMLALTMGLYFGADGSSVQHQGVTPDIILPSLFSLLNQPEPNKYALPHTELGEDHSLNLGFRDEALLSKVRQLSEKRISEDEQYSQIQEFVNRKLKEQSHRQEQSMTSLKAPSPEQSHQQSEDRIFYHDRLIEPWHKLNQLFFNWFQDKKNTQELAAEIRSNDDVLNQALHIAADYFLLCRGEGDEAAQQLPDQRQNQGCSQATAGASEEELVIGK